jgi:hypothetical protein
MVKKGSRGKIKRSSVDTNLCPKRFLEVWSSG